MTVRPGPIGAVPVPTGAAGRPVPLPARATRCPHVGTPSRLPGPRVARGPTTLRREEHA